MTPATRANAVTAVIRFSREREMAAFNNKILSDPEEQTHKLVYADLLDEYGYELPAARLRWWVKLMQENPGLGKVVPFEPRMVPVLGMFPDESPAFEPVERETGLPAWVKRAIAMHIINQSRDVYGLNQPHLTRAMDLATLHGFGLVTDEALRREQTNPVHNPVEGYRTFGDIITGPDEHPNIGGHMGMQHNTAALGMLTAAYQAGTRSSTTRDKQSHSLHAYRALRTGIQQIKNFVKDNPPPA